jgi:hypothetical protein
VFVDDQTRKILGIHPDFDEDELPSWQILQSLQLVRLSYRRFVSGSVDYRVRLALITELGSQFYFACHEARFIEKFSDEVRFKRKRQNVDMNFSNVSQYNFSLDPKGQAERSFKRRASKSPS